MSVRKMREQQQVGIERELMREQSSALGRSGKALREAIVEYRALARNHPRRDAALARVTERLWQLQMQREFVGFVDHNLDAIVREFDVPAEALTHLGEGSRPKSAKPTPH
ncbi:DUF6665 family protein [Ferrimonas balearica]|uniref:DUF6665 family protein n=1 Tax=Ferrimonas balearica TaxID=44012 RepID=UPI001C99BD22|nr:DUF6665 family protein [Ferrimonas balearica]MBY5991213.1 hypothetical protein [Ferrimonas balearica]